MELKAAPGRLEASAGIKEMWATSERSALAKPSGRLMMRLTRRAEGTFAVTEIDDESVASSGIRDFWIC
jgi:hypothetical protein